MKTKLIAMAGAALLTLAMIQTSQASPLITGSINFDGGTVTLDAPLATATTIMSFGGAPKVNNNFGVQPTGAFAGTGNTPVTFGSGFVFNPVLNPAPINNLWTFTLSGITYSFDLQSVSGSFNNGALNLSGLGDLHVTGYAQTVGTWTLTATGSDANNTFTFGFVAGNSAVPDGGATVMLLGMALSGMALLKKKLVA